MQNHTALAAEEIALFCRLQMHVKKELPIRSNEMGVLIFIKKQGEGVTPMMISSFFHIAKPSVTSVINELIRKEYLIKEPSTTDGRSYKVFMTDKANELVESTHNEYFKVIELLKEQMGTEKFNELIQLLQNANKIVKESRK